MVNKNICSCCKGKGNIELFTSIVVCEDCEGKGFVFTKDEVDDEEYFAFYKYAIGFVKDED